MLRHRSLNQEAPSTGPIVPWSFSSTRNAVELFRIEMGAPMNHFRSGYGSDLRHSGTRGP